MKARLATLQDFPRVTQMLRKFLMEQWDQGSPVKVTQKSLEVYRDLARCYLTGSLFGVVVLPEKGDGFALAGEDIGPHRLDTTLGKVATIWAVWMPPELRHKGTMQEMLRFTQASLVVMDFDLAVMAVRESNKEGRSLTEAFGATLEERVYHYRLGAKPHG